MDTIVKVGLVLRKILGIALLPLVWIFLKQVVQVSDRYLPSITAVAWAIFEIEPNILIHSVDTLIRFVAGFVGGVMLGIAAGLLLSKYQAAVDLLLPSIQSTRAVPAVAIVPFFLLWFGFSEVGRYVLVFVGIGSNISIAAYQILTTVPEKDRIMFASFRLKPSERSITYGLPRLLEGLLPTLRFSMAVAISLIIISEFLGSQTGLGYLIQTSNATYSRHVMFLVAIILGLLTVGADKLLRGFWQELIYWRRV